MKLWVLHFAYNEGAGEKAWVLGVCTDAAKAQSLAAYLLGSGILVDGHPILDIVIAEVSANQYAAVEVA